MKADSKERVAIYIAAAVAVALIVFFVTKEYPSRYKDNIIPDKDSVSNALLGAWEINEKVDSGKTIKPTFKEILGFVGSSKEGDMRVYWDTVDSLYKIDKWKLEERDGKSILSLYRWPEWEQEDKTPHETWNISYPDTNTLVLTNIETFDSQKYARIRNAREEAAIDLKRTKARELDLCAKIVKGENTVEDLILLPISCTAAVGPEKAEVTISFKIDGSMNITRESHQIFSASLDETWQSLPFLKAGVFKLTDITYDGYEDIQTLVSAGAYNYYFEFYKFDPERFAFESVPLIDATNPKFDFNERSMESMTLGRGIGDVFTKLQYIFKDGQYVPFEREVQTMMEDTEPPQYERIIEHYDNTEWKLVTKQVLTEDEAFSY